MASRATLYFLVFAAGAAALSWEVLWQLGIALSIGLSAVGAAITLAATMGGMTIGALGMGRLLRGRVVRRPLRLYGFLELLIGLLLGVALPWALQRQDTPAGWARLYAVNTAGAVAGSLLAAWVFLPAVGFARASRRRSAKHSPTRSCGSTPWASPACSSGGAIPPSRPSGRPGRASGAAPAPLAAPLVPELIREAVRLDPGSLARYAGLGEVITDDNQLLAYGRARWLQRDIDFRELFSLKLVERARRGATGWPAPR